jgi:hypothetical protein
MLLICDHVRGESFHRFAKAEFGFLMGQSCLSALHAQVYKETSILHCHLVHPLHSHSQFACGHSHPAIRPAPPWVRL